jgi:voltage-gated potassium channel
LAAATAGAGFWLLSVDFGPHWLRTLRGLANGQAILTAQWTPAAALGIGLIFSAIGLPFRSRIAWTLVLLQLAAALASLAVVPRSTAPSWAIYFLLLGLVLLATWRRFDRASIAAGSLVALNAVLMLLAYATFGALYLGPDFSPPIKDLVTAFYYGAMTMSTLGAADILPSTANARLFTVSVVLLGISVFVTALTALIAPLVTKSVERINRHRSQSMTRKDHFIVVGATSIAANVVQELQRRGKAVTRILRELPAGTDMQGADIVVGDASDTAVLREAGAEHAQALLALRDDDAVNAFTVLALKELQSNARTVALVNETANLGRVRLAQPDIVWAPQVLGAEVLAMLLSGEKIEAGFVLDRLMNSTGLEPRRN